MVLASLVRSNTTVYMFRSYCCLDVHTAGCRRCTSFHPQDEEAYVVVASLVLLFAAILLQR